MICRKISQTMILLSRLVAFQGYSPLPLASSCYDRGQVAGSMPPTGARYQSWSLYSHGFDAPR